MTEAMLPFQVAGAAILGISLGIAARRRGWPPVWTAGLACPGYVLLWVLLATLPGDSKGAPDETSIGTAVLGVVVFVLPGMCVLVCLPMLVAFIFAYKLTTRRDGLA